MEYTCIGCGKKVDHLEVFPGPRCLSCWEPIGMALARTMTADDLTVMWGGKPQRKKGKRS
jgi:DNA-directed RNA polymerase subunit RPC12/RpoP